MEQSYNRKIRPKRILQGFLSGGKEDFVKSRLEECNKCPLMQGGACTVCGCFIKAKTKVKEEFCPENKWNDMKIIENVGIAVANLTEEVVSISHTEKTAILNVDFKRSISVKTPNTFKLKIVNARANYFSAAEETMDNIRITAGCGLCTRITNKKNIPKKIEDGEYFELHVEFTPDHRGKNIKKVTVHFNNKQALYINFSATVI